MTQLFCFHYTSNFGPTEESVRSEKCFAARNRNVYRRLLCLLENRLWFVELTEAAFQQYLPENLGPVISFH